MDFSIKLCMTSVEGGSGDGYGLFIDGYLISAFMRGDPFEQNIEAVLGKGVSDLRVTAKINHELSVKASIENTVVYDLFFNGLHVSRYTEGSFVYQNVMRFFPLEPLT